MTSEAWLTEINRRTMKTGTPNQATRTLAVMLRGTTSDPEDCAERHEGCADYSEEALFSLVELCGGCEWWFGIRDLDLSDDSGNGLACQDCIKGWGA